VYREQLLDLLGEHYAKVVLDITKIPRREIAFARYGRKPDDRLNGFATLEDLRNHLFANQDIVGVYSSVAYYLDPHEPENTKKDFQSWDLIFDLDSHPEEGEPRYEHISRMSELTLQLIDEHLVSEFGFDIGDMKIDWSGNKGFHVTLDDQKYRDISHSSRIKLLNHMKMIGIIDRGLYNDNNQTVNPVCGGWKKRYNKWWKCK